MAAQYNVFQIADFFLGTLEAEKGDSITPLKLQKLVYYAQAWHYTIFDKPLYDEKIEAWTHGPVVKTLWDRFKKTPKDASIDTKILDSDIVEFSDSTLTLLSEVNKIYGEHSGSYLEYLTHSEKPWIMARGKLPIHVTCTNEITLKSMKDYYSTLRNGEK